MRREVRGEDKKNELDTIQLIFYILAFTPYTLHPTPYTLHPTLYTLHFTPYTLNSSPHRGRSLNRIIGTHPSRG